MQNMTDMAEIDPPSLLHILNIMTHNYVTYYLTYYAYRFQGYILFYIYMANNMTKNSKIVQGSYWLYSAYCNMESSSFRISKGMVQSVVT